MYKITGVNIDLFVWKIHPKCVEVQEKTVALRTPQISIIKYLKHILWGAKATTHFLNSS